MTPLLREIIKLSAEALRDEDDYLNKALSNNPAYATDRSGILSINNERYYQFVIAKYLYKHLRKPIRLEDNQIDLVIYPDDTSYKYEVAVEMKRWMSSTGNSEIKGIQKDFDKLSRCDCKKGLMLIFSSNPKHVPTQENISVLSSKIDKNIDHKLWYVQEFDTVGYSGSENTFWVAGYEV